MVMKSNGNYQAIRIGLIRRGTNLRRWALSRGYALSTVYDAAQGNRRGIRAVRIQSELKEFVS